MFDENENIYPVKPELLLGGIGKSRWVFMGFAMLAVLLSIDYMSSTYIVLGEVILVLIIHELGHFLMMRIFRARAQGMFFMSFLGTYTASLRYSNSQKQQAIINLMGPLPGIILGCGLFLTGIYGEPNIYLIEISLLFIGINLLNLVPIDPFDGGRIISSFFFQKNDQLKMIFTLLSSVFIIAAGVVYNFIPLIVFGFLMGLKVRSFQKSSNLHEQLDETNIDYKKEYKDLTNREYWKIRSVFLTHNPKLKEMIPSGYTLWENERLLMEQVRQLLRVNTKADLGIFGKIAVILILIAFITAPIILVMAHFELIDWYLMHADI